MRNKEFAGGGNSRPGNKCCYRGNKRIWAETASFRPNALVTPTRDNEAQCDQQLGKVNAASQRSYLGRPVVGLRSCICRVCELLASRIKRRYNKFGMNAETVRLLLAGCLVAMYVLAMFSLRRCPLTLGQLTSWGVFALFIPALGPFLVILTRPGDPPRRIRARRIRR